MSEIIESAHHHILLDLTGPNAQGQTCRTAWAVAPPLLCTLSLLSYVARTSVALSKHHNLVLLSPMPRVVGVKGLEQRAGVVTTHSTTQQSKVVYRNNSGGHPHHPPQAPTPAQHPTPRVGARPTTRALHPHTATTAHKQCTHVEHHQGPMTPCPSANTAPTTHATTKATLTHDIEGMLP